MNSLGLDLVARTGLSARWAWSAIAALLLAAQFAPAIPADGPVPVPPDFSAFAVDIENPACSPCPAGNPDSEDRFTLQLRKWQMVIALPIGVLLAAFFFAKAEIHIEGDAGWAQNLPTWPIEKHPLLDLFWGGRPMTGYHAWMFSFMALAFHLPVLICGSLSLRIEARILGSLMVFWILEDFFWFLANPAFGLARLTPACVPWHKKWIGGLPADYVIFSVVGAALIWYSFAHGG